VKIIDRAALTHPVPTGVSRDHLGGLIEELADPWLAQQESRLRDRRGGRDRLRAEGAGPAPPKKPGKDATAAEAAAYEQGRHTARSTLWPLPLGCVGLARRFWAGRYWQPRPAAGTGP
jgi:hypothetical protein